MELENKRERQLNLLMMKVTHQRTWRAREKVGGFISNWSMSSKSLRIDDFVFGHGAHISIIFIHVHVGLFPINYYSTNLHHI